MKKDNDFTFPKGNKRQASELIEFNPPLLIIQDNKIIGIDKRNRKPAFENDMCKLVGLRATCNSCDRIIFEDENYIKQYQKNGGYCKECNESN